MERLRRPLVWLTLAWLLAAYAPGVGRGFLKDDFGWIQQSSVGSFSELLGLFGRSQGFYRPMVSVSFALDRALFGLAPLGYGLTNALLLAAAAFAVARLARALGLPPFAASLAACLWALNPHGINMALLWTSGRTSILLTLFAALAATEFVRGRALAASLLALCAMLSKEEAVVLPFVFAAWWVLARGGRRAEGKGAARPLAGRTVTSVLLPFAALAAYFALRWRSGAFTPASAPPYYRFSHDPGPLAFNVFSYVDRAATFGVAALLVVLLVVRRGPRLDAWQRRVVAVGAVWMAAGYALTVWLPVRSSLYALFPSVGAVIVLAMVVGAVLERAPRVRVAPTVAVLLVLAAIAVPIYWSRNDRWVAPSRVSAAVLPQLKDIVLSQPPGTIVVIRDRVHPRESVGSAFGTLLPDAVALVTGRRDVAVWLDPPPGDWQLAGWRPPQPGDRTALFVLRGRTLERAN